MILRILIVNNLKMYGEALRDILAKYPNTEVASEAGEGLEGLE